jgi:ATP-dependent DNA helicase RecG
LREKSSAIDKVVTTIEMYQLPAPSFTVRHQRTVVIIYASRSFDEMLRDARTRACYQHAALKYVMSEPMTNRSLRERCFRDSVKKHRQHVELRNRRVYSNAGAT